MGSWSVSAAAHAPSASWHSAVGAPTSVGADLGHQAEEPGVVEAEIRSVLCRGLPRSVHAVGVFLPSLLMLYFLRSDAGHVAGAGMGLMFTNVAGLSLVVGLGSGAQPLVSQAFSARNFLRCGDLLQQQLAISAVLAAALAGVWWRAEEILVSLGQPPGIAALAGQFVRWRLPALPALFLREDLGSFLASQEVVHFPMAIGLVSSSLNIAGFVYLIPAYGFAGSAMACTAADTVHAVLLYALSRFFLPQPTWPHWSARVAWRVCGWGELLGLAVPSMLLMASEWWVWELNLLFAGWLCGEVSPGGCVQLSVYPIVANTMMVCVMPNLGFAHAAGALVGGALSANQPKKAQRAAYIALAVADVLGGATALALIAFRWRWGRIFSDNAEVVDLTAHVLPTVAAYVFLSHLGPGTISQILRSMSMFTFPAAMNVVAFYMVGTPLGLWLTFAQEHGQWGIAGLWTGLVSGMAFMVVGLASFMWLFVRWPDAADTAHTRILNAIYEDDMEMVKRMGNGGAKVEAPPP